MALINTDHYVTGKNRHRPCEDYAISGLEPVPFAIVSDGCSSSPGSHIGAMLVTLAARKRMQEMIRAGEIFDYEAFGKSVIAEAAAISRSLCLPDTVLDATLLTAWVEADYVSVSVYGDGFVIAKQQSESMPRIVEISLESNAPHYLSYHLDEERNRQYSLQMQGKKIIGSLGRSLGHESDESISLAYDAPVQYRFSLQEFSTVLIASDGLSSFAGSSGAVPAEEVIREFTAFRNYTGQFLKRRAKRVITACEKKSVIQTDDVSLAAIYASSADESQTQ
ncbi:MAG: protein phosphatase 2C domain-containing protein [Desulfococcaceae bacterium]